jgi:hypothetical protein
LDLDLRRRRDALPGAIRWQRPDTEPAGKSEADKSTKISITGGAPLVSRANAAAAMPSR